MRLYCFDDVPQGNWQNWGRHLHEVARKRGIDARLFSRADEVEEGDKYYAFFHLRQHPPELAADKEIVYTIADRVTLVPDLTQLRVYENKIAQALTFGEWMPRTWFVDDLEKARALAESIELPIISKAAEGSNSLNVRFIRTREALQKEVEAAFGAGIPISLGRQQSGYVLWQEFLANNDGDYRVTCVGSHRIMWKRFNRSEAEPFASGSGKIEYLHKGLNDEQRECLATANAFFDAVGTKWCALDMKRDASGAWKVLESTTAWPWGVFTDHELLTRDGELSGRPGIDAWETFLDDIESGYFDAVPKPVMKTAPLPVFEGVAASDLVHRPHLPQLTVVCHQWREGYREYLPEYVNVARRMFARNLKIPHRFVCITNETAGFDREVEIMRPTDEAMRLAKLQSPEGERFPSCYRRLWLWSEEAKVLGPRIFATDLDFVITGDITEMCTRPESFVGWRPHTDWGNPARFAGACFLLTTGAHTRVWEEFVADPMKAIKRARDTGYRGSDQAWISYCMHDQAFWPQHLIAEPERFISFVPKKTFPRGKWQPHKHRIEDRFAQPPEGALILQLCGQIKPWDLKNVAWVKEHWR